MTLLDTSQSGDDALKAVFARELERVRDRSHGLTVDVLDVDELLAQHSRLMSPLVWDLAHVGNYEELWLLRAAAGLEAMRPELDDIYDAFEHPRSERPTLPLLPPSQAMSYLGQVRSKVLDALDTMPLDPANPLLDKGFVYAMVVQHEHQHDETMLATHQLRRGATVLGDVPPPAAPAPPLPHEVLVPGGPFTMGTSDDGWAYDNERPAHEVFVPAFHLDSAPVTNRAYLSFVESGGYDQPRWWSHAGWEWRTASGKRRPAFWLREGGEPLRRRFGRVEPLPLDQPVQHVCYHEADAYARWAGKRLPTEAEWEKAASWDPVTRTKRRYPWGDADPTSEHANLGQRHHQPAEVGAYPAGVSAYGVHQLVGDVWEWTSSGFEGYPGFRSFPYKEYSEVFFGGDYRMLRGGSWASDHTAVRTTFRNWDHPVRRQIFAGFRCARDAAPGEGR
ncbi:MAG: gamma-glutamyl hercynylcysteine S-oxide synthase [Actinomycetota bacterium]|jgi:iron(II)-dependent oxidoreductase|nr:gamma-glutamyl hercynylcysteine S-oxide synthase [Actinomycetota bacterium]